MRAYLPFLILSLTPLCAICQSSAPALDSQEKRQILSQLIELKSCREEVLSYQTYVSRESAQDARESQNAARSLELERQATALAQRERDLALEKANLYGSLY